MRNTFGTRLTVTLFGESHGPEIGCVLDGLRPGLPVDAARISDLLARRRPNGPTATARVAAITAILPIRPGPVTRIIPPSSSIGALPIRAAAGTSPDG